jgi:transcriptional regulator CBF1
MDQAMGDLQSQLDEMRRMWEEERQNRARAEAELELLRGLKIGNKEDGAGNKEDDSEERNSKRQRVE